MSDRADRAASPPGCGGQALRLGIVDDHEVFRLGLRSLLERVGGIEVAWDTGSAHDAWSRAAEQAVDAVMVDVNLGGPVDGLEVTRILTARDPSLVVILMSGLVDETQLAMATGVGAAGFLPKGLPASEMVDALMRLVRRQPGAAPPRREHRRMVFQDEHGLALEALSVRELEVLAEIRRGRTNREIAEKLRVSTSTVNKHVHRVLRKLRVRNRAEAAIVAAELLARPRRP
jgi:RNA polymerase sigma factor (sigma-70 family)